MVLYSYVNQYVFLIYLFEKVYTENVFVQQLIPSASFPTMASICRNFKQHISHVINVDDQYAIEVKDIEYKILWILILLMLHFHTKNLVFVSMWASVDFICRLSNWSSTNYA